MLDGWAAGPVATSGGGGIGSHRPGVTGNGVRASGVMIGGTGDGGGGVSGNGEVSNSSQNSGLPSGGLVPKISSSFCCKSVRLGVSILP